MAEYYKGTLLASPIVRGSSGDTYGTHHSVLGVGGFMEVNTIAERNAIPPTGATQIANAGLSLNFDGISIGQRRLGMLVYVERENKTYQLQIPYATWSGYTSTQKQNALVNNSNWVEWNAGNITGENISKLYSQTTHGFVKGDVIGYNGSQFLKVLNTGTTTAYEPLGIVSEISNANTFRLTYAGAVNTAGITDYTGGTLTVGKEYFLSNIAGKLTKYSPYGIGIVNKPILYTTSGNTGVVLEYRGITKEEVGVSVGIFNTYTGATKILLDKTVTGATNIGYWSGMTGVQTLLLSNFGVNYDGLYYSQYNNYYRDASGIIRLGSPTYRGLCRRGYVNAARTYSWVYNLYTGGGQCVGWILTSGDIGACIGSCLNGITYGGTPYSATTWSTFCTNSVTSVNPTGSLTTGTTYNFGGPIYANKCYQELNLRTICSATPSTLKICYDNNFIKISGASASTGLMFACNGLTKIGNTVILGGALTGNTCLTGNHTFATCCGAKLNTQCGLQISGYTIYDTTRCNADNIRIGRETGLASNTVGVQNVAMGYGALYSNTIGNYNIAIGSGNMWFNTCGCHNIVMGHNNLVCSTRGSCNIALGICTLYYNTTGCTNIALGVNSMYCNLYGHNNVAIGCSALRSNRIGRCNVAIGECALWSSTSGHSNIAIGSGAIASNSNGCNNVAAGLCALYQNTTGSQNIAIGYSAMQYNQTGSQNIAFGTNALQCRGGGSNIAIGVQTLMENRTGVGNIAIGQQAIQYISGGSCNVGIGSYALFCNASASGQVAVGSWSLYTNKYVNPSCVGCNNTAIGYNTLRNNTYGCNNVVVGYDAGCASVTGCSNVFIGYSAGKSELGSNRLYVANSDTQYPLICGNFTNRTVLLNGTLAVSGVTCGTCSDSTLVWNSATCCIRRVPYFSANTFTNLTGTAYRLPRYCVGGVGISATTLNYCNNILCSVDPSDFVIQATDTYKLALIAVTTNNNYINFGSGAYPISSVYLCACGSCSNVDMFLMPKGSGCVYNLACATYIGPSGPFCNGYIFRCTNLCLPKSGIICGYAGVSGDQNACPMWICGGLGYGVGGESGDGGYIYVCGGSASGTVSKSGGTITIQGGLGVCGGCTGRIKLLCLPARTTESCSVYISAGGTLSYGMVSQQPVCCYFNSVTPYTTQTSDYFIGTCSGTTIYLTASPAVGEIKIVSDVCGSAGSGAKKIIVNANSKYIIGSNSAEIDTKWGSVTFQYIGINNNWSVIAFTAAPTYA